jgi:hypothetical protein
MPNVILGLKGPLFLSLLKKPPLFAGAHTAFRIAANKLLVMIINFLMLHPFTQAVRKRYQKMKKNNVL